MEPAGSIRPRVPPPSTPIHVWELNPARVPSDALLRATPKADLVVALARVLDRVIIETRAGAPSMMLEVYVKVEALHAVARHPGEAQDCDRCLAEVVRSRPEGSPDA
jgi:hypothetical protein